MTAFLRWYAAVQALGVLALPLAWSALGRLPDRGCFFARALGVLLEVTEPAQLLPRAREIAAQIAAKPPLAVRYAKRTLRLAQRQGLAEHLESCASFQAALQKSEDHQEALAAFFEKRAGRFKGR